MRHLAQTLNAPDAGPTRRSVVIGTAMLGGSMLVGCSLADLMSLGNAKMEFGAFGPFLKIDPNGDLTVISKHIEFGQGNHAGLAAMVAEELDADWSKVKVEQAPANAKVYGNSKTQGIQLTGGSTAIASSWDIMRLAGAAARAMFVGAAAKTWGVPASQLTIKDSVVSHAESGKSASFAQLLPEASKIAPPSDPKVKNPKDFTLVGTDRVRRKDSRQKSTGTAIYTQDVKKPDLLTALVAHAPQFGAAVKSFDDTEARKVSGVVDIFKIKSGVAVVANSFWQAKTARDALKVEWDMSKAETRSSDQILDDYRQIASGAVESKWDAFDSKGDFAAAPKGRTLELEYDFPYLAHATMEPMNCVAEVDGNKCKLTFASQGPTLDQMNVAQVVGNLPGAIEIETLFAGGSFGRRSTLQSDYVVECAAIAKKIGKGRPVKLVWTREDDMGAGYFRPLTLHKVKVVIAEDGFPAAWQHRIVSQSIMAGSPMAPKGVDATMVEGAMGSPYLKATPIVDAKAAQAKVHVPVLWWRSVGATHTAYVMEHTIDQLARMVGKDPVDYRRALYRKAGADRHLAVMELAVEKAGWGKPTEGFSQGIAVHESFGSVVAEIAEVKLENGEPRIGRVVVAVDCGIAISPNQIAAQMEGGVCYGLSATLFDQMVLKDGKVDRSNFDSYRVLRHHEAPSVETHILPSQTAPSGIGEPGTPVIGPAVANALLAMEGKPRTSLPLVKA
jgi:isoquinoline 1-oxidoreductase beta subunit